MIPSRLFKTLSAFVCSGMAVCIFFLLSRPLLRFASAGNVHHLPTQIAVLIIRVLAYGNVLGFLGLSCWFICRLRVQDMFRTVFFGIYLVMVGIGMRMGVRVGPWAVSMVPAAIILLSVLLRRLQPAILVLENKLRTQDQ
jgi:hypothetical protein